MPFPLLPATFLDAERLGVAFPNAERGNEVVFLLLLHVQHDWPGGLAAFFFAAEEEES